MMINDSDLECLHKDIGDRLKAFRAHLGLTAVAFAKKHGYNRVQYANWEAGRRRIPIEQAAKLEETYGLTLDFLYLGRISSLKYDLANSMSDKLLELSQSP